MVVVLVDAVDDVGSVLDDRVVLLQPRTSPAMIRVNKSVVFIGD